MATKIHPLPTARSWHSAQMVSSSPFRYPITAPERFARKLYSETLRRFGVVPFVMPAQGARFLVDTTDLIDRWIAWEGMWEGPQLDAIARVCRAGPADYFLDVGANSGFYSVMIAVKGLARDVIAFEPDPGNFARLTANLALNHLDDKVRALPYAVGAKAAEMTLNQAGAGNRGESWIVHPDQPPEEAAVVATHRVKQIRFDDEFHIAGQRIIMKMDVEGSEFHALAGMERTLRDNQCYVQVELYSNRFDELKALFGRLDYRFLHTEYIDHFFTNMPDVG
jgi:FkbM family methyltransferase